MKMNDAAMEKSFIKSNNDLSRSGDNLADKSGEALRLNTSLDKTGNLQAPTGTDGLAHVSEVSRLNASHLPER